MAEFFHELKVFLNEPTPMWGTLLFFTLALISIPAAIAGERDRQAFAKMLKQDRESDAPWKGPHIV